MSETLTQAAIVRRVKAVVAGYRAAGVNVTGGKVTFHNGDVSVEVTAAPDSPALSVQGGPNVHELAERIKAGVAARRP